MTEVQQDLLSLLACALFDVPTDAVLTPEVIAEAKVQAVSSLVSNDYPIIGQNICVLNAHAELTKMLAGIPFTTFKGYASAYYYPKPIYRPMGDVDFIVDPERYTEAIERLVSAGWQKDSTEHERHETFFINRVELELHHEIKGIPNGADGIETDIEAAEAKIREQLADLISTAVTTDTQHGPVIIPDDYHHGLIMLLHVAGHMINDGGVGLRHLCDWAVYVNRVDVSKFRERLKSLGLWTFARQLTAVSSRYLGLPEQSWCGEWSDEFLSVLIEDILAAGNFGQKEVGRRATMQLKKKTFAGMTAARYPQAKGILLPIFMVVYVLRYAWLIARGERTIIKPSTFVGARDRDRLYKQFRLFEE